MTEKVTQLPQHISDCTPADNLMFTKSISMMKSIRSVCECCRHYIKLLQNLPIRQWGNDTQLDSYRLLVSATSATSKYHFRCFCFQGAKAFTTNRILSSTVHIL